MAQWRYSLFGFDLESDSQLPGLIPTPAMPAADPVIRLTMVPDHRAPVPDTHPVYTSPLDQDGNGLRVWRHAATRYGFYYADGATFEIDINASTIAASWPTPLTLDDAASYLYGHVMGFLLGRHNRFCLHASAVVLGDRAIGLLAPSGGGKSTTAAAFACRGIPVISDDILAIDALDNTFMVHPGYPRVKLWATAATVLHLTDADLPRLSPTHPTWDKRYLDLVERPCAFYPDPAKLAVMYVGEIAEESISEPEILPISKSEAAVMLLANRYRFPLADSDELKIEFEWASRLSECIPMRRIRYHRNPGSLTQLCRSIEADFSRFAEQAA